MAQKSSMPHTMRGGEAVGDTQYDRLAPWLHGSSELLVAVG